MAYLVNLALDGKPVVVVGGGRVASRKVTRLVEAGARVIVVAPDVCQQIEAHAVTSRVEVRRRRYVCEDVQGASLVVAATNDESVNAQVSADAQALGTLVNVVDRPPFCTFTLPAVMRRGHLSVAVATDGRCPALARAIREEIESRYGPEYELAVVLFAGLRQAMMARGWDSARIQHALSNLYRTNVMKLVGAGRAGPLGDLLHDRFGDDLPLAVLDTIVATTLRSRNGQVAEDRLE